MEGRIENHGNQKGKEKGRQEETLKSPNQEVKQGDAKSVP